jgi:hypothetical protein
MPPLAFVVADNQTIVYRFILLLCTAATTSECAAAALA